MYKDLLSYKLADGITEDHLIKVSQKIIESWMKNLEGFISWEINKNDEGGYTDIVCWKNKDLAKEAEKKMCEIPNAEEWYNCYEKGSMKAVHLDSISHS